MATLQSDAKVTVADSKAKYKGKSGAQIFHEMLIQQHKVEVMFDIRAERFCRSSINSIAPRPSSF